MATTLPLGFDSLEQLIGSEAGRVYAAARIIPINRQSYLFALAWVGVYPVARRETATPPHPECYAYRFADGSLLVVSNASDEVWESELDYLSEYELRVSDDGASYVPA